MDDSSSQRNIVEVLAEEFLQRFRDGERPPLTEYTQRHPEHAEEIEDLFPALLLMEDLKPDDYPSEAVVTGVDPALQQLGDYRIIREVGRGGMGIVYEAEQVSLGRHVALKVLPKELLATPKHRARFEREARAAAKLHHTNIVPVFGVGQEDEMGYYVMQFIQGLALDEVLDELKKMNIDSGDFTDSHQVGELRVGRRDASAADVAHSLMSGSFRPSLDGEDLDPGETLDGQVPAKPTMRTSNSGRLSDTFAIADSSTLLDGSASGRSAGRTKRQTYWRSVATIGAQVAEALEYAHGQGVLHRDIKPANLLLDMQGTVWVTDFGLAKLEDDRGLTETGDILGTLRYMAPETFKGNADARSEIYSLGLTLYEMLVFRPAFEQTQRNTLVDQVMNSTVASLGSLQRELPQDLQTIVHKAIERDPKHRYQTAGELADDLQRFVNDEPIQARKTSLVERSLRWSRRNRGLAASLAAVAVLVLAINIVGPVITVKMTRMNRDLHNSQGELTTTIGDLTETKDNLESTVNTLQSTQANLRTARDRTEQHLYAARIALAQNLLNSADASSARRNLAEAVDTDDRLDHLGWEWHYLNRWSDGAVRTFDDGGGRTHDVAFTPDGKLLASSRGGNIYSIEHGTEPTPGVIDIRDFATGRILHQLNGHRDVAAAIAFSPDGKTLASAGHDKVIIFWNVETGEEIGRIDASNQSPRATPRNLKFSVDGLHVFAIWKNWDQADELWGQGSIYSVTKKASVQELEIRSMEFSHDGSHLYYVPIEPQGTIRVQRMDAEHDERLLPSWIGEGRMWGLKASSRGTYLAAVNERRILIWDLEHRVLVQSLPVAEGMKRIAFSRDERLVCTFGESNYVQVWEVSSGRIIATLLGTCKVTGATFSPDNRWFVTSNDDGLIRVFSTSRDPRATCCDCSTWQQCALSFNDDGTQLRSVNWEGARIYGWEVQTNRQLFKNMIKATDSIRYRRDDYAFNRGGTRLAAPALGKPNSVSVWDSESGEQQLSLDHAAGVVTCVAFDRGDTMLASGSQLSSASELRCWNADNGNLLKKFPIPERWVTSVACHSTGIPLVAGGFGDGISIWELESGKERLHFETATRVYRLAFSPEGKRIAVALSDESRVLVWDVEQGKQIAQIDDIRWVSDVAWSPDGTRLAAIGSEAHVHLFDAATLHELIVLRSTAPPTGTSAFTPSVVFSQDSAKIAANGVHGVVTVWDAGDEYANIELASIVNDAQAYLDNPQYDAAFEAATQAVAREGLNGPAQRLRCDAYNVLAECHQQRGDSAAAQDALAQGQSLLADLAASEAAEFAPNWDVIGPRRPAIQIASAVEIDDVSIPPELVKLNTTLKADPSNAKALLERGRLNEELAHDDQAFSDYTNALEADAELAEAWRRRAKMYVFRQEPAKAAVDLTRYLELEPSDTQAYRARGELYLQLEKWQEVVDDFSRVITAETQDAGLLAQRGDAYKQLERWEEAVADWKRAVELKPQDPDFVYRLLYERAKTLDWILQRNEEAEVAWSWVIEARPDDSAYPLMNRANLYRAFGQLDKAMADLDRAVEQPTGRYKSLLTRGGFLASQGQWTRAADDLANSFQHSLPVSVRYNVYLHHALLQLMTDDVAGYQAGLTKLDEYLAEEMDSQQALWLVNATVAGPVALTQEHHDRLLGVLDKHLAEKDAAWKPRLTAALHYRAGMFEAAAELFDKHRKGPDWPGFHFLAAMAHHHLGNHESAGKAFKEATNLIAHKEAEVAGPAVPPRQNWRTWAIFKCLQREATSLLDRDPA